MKTPLISSLMHLLVAAVLTAMPAHQALAAPGALPSSPLFLSSIVEPNVFLTMDDSRSMTFATLVSQDTGKLRGASFTVSAENIPTILLNTPIGSGLMSLTYIYDVPANNDLFVVPPRSVASEAWVFKSPQANKLYYNPNVIYIPWPGSDAGGLPLYDDYTDPGIGVKSVALYPEDPASPTVDITQKHSYGTWYEFTGKSIYLPTYYIWDETNDVNNNGVIDADTDTFQEFIIPSNDTAQLGNFANWFAYYRSRQSTMKSGVGRIVNNTDSNRMGLRLFNKKHLMNAETMTDSANKLKLLEALYSSNGLDIFNPDGTINEDAKITPARTALEATGLMFANEISGIPSPILDEVDGGTCQQNFNLLMTDGYWNGPEPTWNTKPSKDTKNTDASTDLDPSIFDGDASQSNDGGNYADIYNATLADVGMHFYENDLRADLLDKVVPRAGVDEATHQHLVNYTLSFGMEGTLDPTTDPAVLTDPPFVWPPPVAGTATTIDDLWHTSYNSRGQHLVLDGSSSDLESKLNLSISDVTERTATAAAVAVNSARLSTESVIYLAQFNTNRWQGNLFAYPIIDTSTGQLADSPKWDAASQLNSRLKMYGDGVRKIITYDKSLAAPNKGVPFQWANMSLTMEDDLNMSPTGAPDADGASRLAYIRGDRTKEISGKFRERISMLGDLVNSGPVFVGPPNLAWKDRAPFPTGDDAYSKFKELYIDRQGMVYVGANDGMLHAFNDDTGKEEFGYIPGAIYSQTVNEGLHYLTDQNYIHNFYVDLSPTLSDVFITTPTASNKWHTVLVGGLRSGGRGIYALDVTNPVIHADEASAASMSLWEFTNEDDADLGYTYSRPIIGLSNAGTWVAIFGNGYNPVATNANGQSSTGEASLFIVDIEKGTDGNWVAGDYQKITTGIGSPGDQNGLSPPALADVNGDGTIDRAYAGDLRGNMWVFDLTSTMPGNWAIASKSGSTPVPLFTAAAKQPITAKPVLASHPTVPNSKTNAPNIMVYFGTGQYLVNGDKITTDTQAFHGVWDNSDSQLTNADLVKQEFDATYTAGRVLTRKPVDYAVEGGCYFDLTDSGERAVTSPIARADTVFFNSFVPVENACSQGGYGYRFAVDMATCGSPLLATIDSNDDNIVDDKDYVSNGSADSTLAAVRQEGFLPEPVFIEDLAFTGEQAFKIKSLSSVPTGRFSWQELLF